MHRTTLGEYAKHEFPGHDTDLWRGVDPPLADHSVVVHVVGREGAERTIELLEDRLDEEHVGAVLIKSIDPTITPRAEEDGNGVYDLPNERIAVSAILGACTGVLLGIAAAVVFSLPWTAGFALAMFLALAGGMVVAIAGGGARHASERAVTQQQAPGEDIGVIAALVDDEPLARELAGGLAEHGLYDVRIVGPQGGWHVPP